MKTFNSHLAGYISGVIGADECCGSADASAAISGPVNADDLRFLSQKTSFSVIDLSQSSCLDVIGADAFYLNSRLQCITLGASVKQVNPQAFSGCTSLSAINVAPGNASLKSVDGVVYSADGSCLVKCPEGREGVLSVAPGTKVVLSGAVNNCNRLSGIVFPEGLESVQDRGVCLCSGISSISLPASLRHMGSTGLRMLRGLSHIQVDGGNKVFSCPDGVSLIKREQRFGQQFNVLVKVAEAVGDEYRTAPEASYVDAFAFDGCDHVLRFIFSASVKACDELAFYNTSSCELVRCLGSEPPLVHRRPGIRMSLPTRWLYMPKGTYPKYHKSPYWNCFLFSVEADE